MILMYTVHDYGGKKGVDKHVCLTGDKAYKTFQAIGYCHGVWMYKGHKGRIESAGITVRHFIYG
jgi:hypothetical protein